MTDLPNSESTDTVLLHAPQGSASLSGSDTLGREESSGTTGSGPEYFHELHSEVSEGVFTRELNPYRTSFLSASTGAVTLLHLESEIESLEKAQVLKSFAEELNDEMIDQPPEAAQAVEENFWDLF